MWCGGVRSTMSADSGGSRPRRARVAGGNPAGPARRRPRFRTCSHPVCRAARWSLVDGESRLCTVAHMDSITCADADLRSSTTLAAVHHRGSPRRAILSGGQDVAHLDLSGSSLVVSADLSTLPSRKRSSQRTQRWREPDSNHRSRSLRKGVSRLLPAGPISRTRIISTDRLARRRWLAAGGSSKAISFTAGPMVRIHLSPAANHRRTASWLVSVRRDIGSGRR
jgi:hypothetical protein